MDTPGSPRLRVFLADDHPLILSGIRARLATDPGIEVVGVAADGPAAVQGACALAPDVAVIDLSMPGLNGIEVARRLLAVHPGCRVLILTTQEDGAYLRELLALGIAGCVLKRSPVEDLVRAIQAVAAGGTYLDPAVAGRLAAPLSSRPVMAGPAAVAALSAREADVLRLSALGKSNKAIAADLRIGVKTVDTYKSRAMGKLGFSGRVDLIRFAAAQGWIGT